MTEKTTGDDSESLFKAGKVGRKVNSKTTCRHNKGDKETEIISPSDKARQDKIDRQECSKIHGSVFMQF
jgi:hypothetical protein